MAPPTGSVFVLPSVSFPQWRKSSPEAPPRRRDRCAPIHRGRGVPSSGRHPPDAPAGGAEGRYSARKVPVASRRKTLQSYPKGPPFSTVDLPGKVPSPLAGNFLTGGGLSHNVMDKTYTVFNPGIGGSILPDENLSWLFMQCGSLFSGEKESNGQARTERRCLRITDGG